MKKALLAIMLVCVLALVGCGSGGGSGSGDNWTKPAWAVDGAYPIAAFADNGDLVGYVAGVDAEMGYVVLYNPDMGKFFEMSMEGSMRGFRRTGIYADDNCNLYYYKRFASFIYRNDHPEYARISSGQFGTFSKDISLTVTIDDLMYRPWTDCNDYPCVYSCDIIPDQYPEIHDGLRDYWNDNWPGMKFYPAIEYTTPLPFKYPTGELTFSMD